MTIGVITRVPNPLTEDGNLASALVYRLPPDLTMLCMTQGRIEVFTLGEILILDEYGREIGGAQRKPGKWHVEVEYFADLEEAVVRAREVTA